ncbi:MAG: hypothetical protein GY719_03375 [bacterium]|nr:hypothetical protein [bacterium]
MSERGPNLTVRSIAGRLDAAVDLMLRIAAGTLEARGEVSDRGDQIDAVVVGLNMLSPS